MLKEMKCARCSINARHEQAHVRRVFREVLRLVVIFLAANRLIVRANARGAFVPESPLRFPNNAIFRPGINITTCSRYCKKLK